MNFNCEYFDTPLGVMRVSASDKGITETAFVDTTDSSDAANAEHGNHLTSAAVNQPKEYFRGERRTFDLPLAAGGTAFRQQVWQALMTVPYGETCSYAAIAQKIGNPKAVRAVGTSNGANPIAIIVPCHRVIGANGKLTGYAGGLDRKRWLLAHEQQSDTGEKFLLVP